MNFESQGSHRGSSNQNRLVPEETHTRVDEGQLRSNSNGRFGFGVNDFVVYPAHGPGQILAIEETTIAGGSLEFFVIYFTKSKMTLRVPTQKATNLGMRELSNRVDVERARRTLSEAPAKSRGNWSKLALEYASKINSGNIIAVAEVMRDLYRPNIDSGQSYSERQLYVSAIDRISGEIALIDGIGEEEVIKELEKLVTDRTRRTT